ncbi:orotate phosphoribosyltransferase [soil metagenome]
MDRSQLAAALSAACTLTGRFTLRSGQVSNTYFDKYRFEGDPGLLDAVAEQLVELVPAGTEVLAGLELGGVPIATALSLRTGLPAAFVRKEAKAYGTARLAEGADVDGRRVLVVEDVVTTGGQVAISTTELRQRGARIDTVVCVLDRSGGEIGALRDAGLDLRSLFSFDELR